MGSAARERSATHWLRSLSHSAQAACLRGAILFLRCLGPENASNFGGWLVRVIGPMLSTSRIADDNLRHAFPLLDYAERKKITRAVWDNLGRNAAELPYLKSLQRSAGGPGWEIEGEAHIEQLRAAGTPILFFSGHLGNWEMILPIAASLGLPVAGFYRAASNLKTDAIIQSLRGAALDGGVSMFAKGAQGARAALAHLQAGGSLGMLVDQKMNDGIAVPFFGRIAMTAPALAQFALRFAAPVVPIRVIRLGPARFKLVCEAPLVIPRTGDRTTDTYAIMLAVNETLERWITEQPESWLWLHRRWPKA